MKNAFSYGRLVREQPRANKPPSGKKLAWPATPADEPPTREGQRRFKTAERIMIPNLKFPLGTTVITPNAMGALHPTDVSDALRRHALGDWGDVCDEDRTENEFSLDKYLRLFSVYHDRNGTKFWIITEADRSATTILLPEDY
jgi:hypothetical protein